MNTINPNELRRAILQQISAGVAAFNAQATIGRAIDNGHFDLQINPDEHEPDRTPIDVPQRRKR